jgi:peptide/nickel transport system ATP-binding protein
MLTVNKLTISFPPHPPVVQDLSFTLEAGQRLGILGLSGSGKSMTALALLGLLPAGARTDYGEAWYQPAEGPAIDLLQLSGQDWRRYRGRELSLVFQEPLTALNPVHRVGDQLLEAVQLLCPELRSASDRQAHVREWLGRVELNADQVRILKAYPHQLSGGQRQRILIALALLGGPRLLIADEPTTALDTITEAGILQLLARLRAELGMASIFITHDLGVMARSADELIVMAAGRSIRRGKADALLTIGEELFTEGPVSRTSTGVPVKRRPYLSGTSTDVSENSPALKITNLHLAYPTPTAWPWSKAQPLTVVKDVSFTLMPGEWLAIVGPSGCGKTTIARCLAGLMPRDGGQVELPKNGNVQLVFQDPFSSLNPAHTIRRALSEVLRVHLPGKKKTTYHAEAGRLLDEVGLPANIYADRKPNALSGGQRQRVAIARALAANPTVLIADEAVSALDAPLRRDVLDLLDDIRRTQQIALLFISHDLAMVADRADRVLIMENGLIVEQGIAEEVFAAPVSSMGKRLVAAGA